MAATCIHILQVRAQKVLLHVGYSEAMSAVPHTIDSTLCRIQPSHSSAVRKRHKEHSVVEGLHMNMGASWSCWALPVYAVCAPAVWWRAPSPPGAAAAEADWGPAEGRVDCW